MGSNQSDRPRKVKAVVISDVHLGTYGCKARELNDYLRSIQPEILVLNGDIVDVWRFSKSFFPDEHFMTIRIILAMMAKGTVVYFIPGNHDEALRRFAGTKAGNFLVEGRYYYALSDFYKSTKKDYFSRSAHGTIVAKITYLFDLKK